MLLHDGFFVFWPPGLVLLQTPIFFINLFPSSGIYLPRILKNNNNVDCRQYSSIDGRYLFEPIAIKTLGVYSTSARQLLSDLGRKISQCSGEVREMSFLFQRCSVLVQRFNAVLLHNSLPASDCMDFDSIFDSTAKLPSCWNRKVDFLASPVMMYYYYYYYYYLPSVGMFPREFKN